MGGGSRTCPADADLSVDLRRRFTQMVRRTTERLVALQFGSAAYCGGDFAEAKRSLRTGRVNRWTNSICSSGFVHLWSLRAPIPGEVADRSSGPYPKTTYSSLSPMVRDASMIFSGST